MHVRQGERATTIAATTAIAAIFSALTTPVSHAADAPTTLQEVTVSASNANLVGVADSASEGTVGARQLANRPLLRPAEVMETVPGMIVTQHSGDGKANQYFLRGFNLDHGSDFASFANGAPVNMVSHAHGQGYMDLNFLIPELVGSLRYRKGVYAAEDGDLAVTGVARIDYARSLPAPFVDASLGEHGYRRLLTAGSHDFGDFTLLGAIELGANNGPWEQPEHLGKINGVLRLSSGNAANGYAANGYALTAMAYRADWTATEHVPERAITSGEIGRFGTLANTDGGQTHRYSLSGEWAQNGETGGSRANAYVIDYGLNLFSTPSGFLDGQHEQEDQRIVWGGQLDHSWLLGSAWRDTEATLGLQFRQDRIDRLGLFRTVERTRTSTVRLDKGAESVLGLYGEAKTQWLPWLRSSVGVRLDEALARVTALAGQFNQSNGGSDRATQTSPKLGLVFGPFAGTEFYANWGRGFHSNDMRGATSTVNAQDGSAIEPVKLLATATGSEIGLRTTPLPGWNTSLSLWQMTLDSELVFVGDAGVTEPKGASRRHGLEWSNYYTFKDWLILDGDVALSSARFVVANNGGTHVPNAIPRSASLAVSADRHGPWFGGLRLRYVGAYALEETGEQKSTPFWTANLKLGYRFDPKLQLTLDILNLFDREANDIEYWGAACTKTEGAGCNGGNGFDGRLVHPLEPRTFRLSLRASF